MDLLRRNETGRTNRQRYAAAVFVSLVASWIGFRPCDAAAQTPISILRENDVSALLRLPASRSVRQIFYRVKSRALPAWDGLTTVTRVALEVNGLSMIIFPVYI